MIVLCFQKKRKTIARTIIEEFRHSFKENRKKKWWTDRTKNPKVVDETRQSVNSNVDNPIEKKNDDDDDGGWIEKFRFARNSRLNQRRTESIR